MADLPSNTEYQRRDLSAIILPVVAKPKVRKRDYPANRLAPGKRSYRKEVAVKK
jgi:hypothetical protein